jgi:4-amino-4-deoxy-L-arabinose transferase-like glycosyltransferase
LTSQEWFVKTRTVKRRTQLVIALSILAIAVRLIVINQPYIDNWSWRQSDVAAIAQNFYANGFHFAHPQIDWAGDQPGYVGTEFPILPFAAAIGYKFLGVHEWIGRMQAVILFAASLPFFFLLVRKIFGEIAAVWALVFYCFAPLNVFTSREFMPDVPSLSLGIIGLYFFLRWIDNEEMKHFFTAALAILLSILIKPPSALLGAPLAFLAWQKWRWNFLRQPALCFFAAATLLPSAVWYWHAHEIAAKFYPHHFFGAGGVRIENLSWYGKIGKQIAISSLTPPLFALATVGILAARSTMRARVFGSWLAAMIFFIIVVGYGNRHQWYQLPLVPIAAAFAGAGCAFVASKVPQRRAKVILSILFAVAFLIFAFAWVRPLYRSPSSAALRDLGLELKRVTLANALIVAADNGDPTVFYYAGRKGWHLLEDEGIYEGEPMDSAQAIVNLDKLRARGATHLAFTFNTVWWLDYYREFAQHVDATATLVRATPEFRIYKLQPQTE